MAEITGSVSAKLINLPNSKALVKVSAGVHSVLSPIGPPWQQDLSLEGVAYESADPKVTVELLDPKTKQSLGTVEAHIKSAVDGAGHWGAERVLEFPKGKLMLVKWRWEAVDHQDYILTKYVRKIQAVWRGRRARKQIEVLKRDRKLVCRKGVEANEKLYLVSCFKTEDGFELHLHRIDATDAPIRTLLHTLKVSGEDAESIIGRVQVTAEDQLQVPQA